MVDRRKFVKTGIATLAGITLLPAVDTFASPDRYFGKNRQGHKLRFALASDGHYAEPNTDSDTFYGNLVDWLHQEHARHHLDLVIVNGDLVHNRPDLLPKVKSTYLDKLPVPYYTIPGNHDFADAAVWKSVFGYEDAYTQEFGDIGFIFANTATTKGEYKAPDLVFLKEALEKQKGKSIVFVILHIPPHQWVPEDKDIFVDSPETMALLHAYPNVKAVFHGHDHSLDSVRYTDKLPHFFDSHFGGSWGTEYKGYRIVEVGMDLQIYTYQVNGSKNPTLNATALK